VAASTVNEHGAVIAAGEVIGWVRQGGCANAACLAASGEGRPWHATPRAGTLPTYHFCTMAEAIEAIEAGRS
jgi:hypothetical protein